MNPYEDPQLDALLREALEPGDEVVERIVRGALHRAETPPTRRPSARWVLAGATALALLMVSVWLTSPSRAPDTPTEQAVTHSGTAEVTDPPVRLRISAEAGTVTVTTAEGTRWITFSADTQPATQEPPPDGV
jgi:hypothetical protein